uniref:Uncharacterized protein n=1 Tax=Arundo donax TaxID=35708 RepID=A0A0A9HEK4_ARUDO
MPRVVTSCCYCKRMILYMYTWCAGPFESGDSLARLSTLRLGVKWRQEVVRERRDPYLYSLTSTLVGRRRCNLCGAPEERRAFVASRDRAVTRSISLVEL